MVSIAIFGKEKINAERSLKCMNDFSVLPPRTAGADSKTDKNMFVTEASGVDKACVSVNAKTRKNVRQYGTKAHETAKKHKNVSRETFRRVTELVTNAKTGFVKITANIKARCLNQLKKRRKLEDRPSWRQGQLDKVRAKGTGITPVNVNEADRKTQTLGFKALYSSFRQNKLSCVESAYNALYLYCNDRYYGSKTPVKQKYQTVYAHPKAWFTHQHRLWKANVWSVAVSLLEVVPRCKALCTKVLAGLVRIKPTALWKHLEYSHNATRVYKTMALALLYCGTILCVAYGITQIYGKTNMVPVIRVYVDNKYIGNVMSISEVENAKNAYENVVSTGMKRLYGFDCDISYKSALGGKADLLQMSELNLAFDKAFKRSMRNGFGLYVDGVLVAVCDKEQWIDCAIDDSLSHKRSSNETAYKDAQNLTYNNAITVSAGVFPKSMFMSQSQIRALFSLEAVTDADKQTLIENSVAHDFAEIVGTHDHIHNTSKLELGAILQNSESDGLSYLATPSLVADVMEQGVEGAIMSGVTLDIEIEKLEEYPEDVKFDVVRINDNTLAENKVIIKQKGKNGKKLVTYSVSYMGDNVVDKKVMSEVITLEPTEQIEIVGTRPLTEEEKRTMSTGTYCWPSEGRISSKYSWRVFGGRNEFHKGLDICASLGTEIVASDGGLVISSGWDNGGYGKMVLIQHDDGTLTRYAHCSSLYVEEGQRVAKGERIAGMGRTGQATGVHVHFEIIVNGSVKNPLDYLE